MPTRSRRFLVRGLACAAAAFGVDRATEAAALAAAPIPARGIEVLPSFVRKKDRASTSSAQTVVIRLPPPRG